MLYLLAQKLNRPGPFNLSTSPDALTASTSLVIPDVIAASTISGKNFTSTTIDFRKIAINRIDKTDYRLFS
jgi:hypothetical protein